MLMTCSANVWAISFYIRTLCWWNSVVTVNCSTVSKRTALTCRSAVTQTVLVKLDSILTSFHDKLFRFVSFCPKPSIVFRAGEKRFRQVKVDPQNALRLKPPKPTLSVKHRKWPFSCSFTGPTKPETSRANRNQRDVSMGGVTWRWKLLRCAVGPKHEHNGQWHTRSRQCQRYQCYPDQPDKWSSLSFRSFPGKQRWTWRILIFECYWM